MLDLVNVTNVDEPVKQAAAQIISALLYKSPYRKISTSNLPEFDPSTHAVTISGNDGTLIVREWDPVKSIYLKVDNHLSPAEIHKDGKTDYYLQGMKLSREAWEAARDAQTSPRR